MAPLLLALLSGKTCITIVQVSTVQPLEKSRVATPFEPSAGVMMKRESFIGSAKTNGALTGEKTDISTSKPVQPI
jgi:hypothetical protein